MLQWTQAHFFVLSLQQLIGEHISHSIYMKNTLLFVFLLAVAPLWGQQCRKDIMADVHFSASGYLAYPGPRAKLTPAPKGYEAVYLSHYGRHGSRYLIGTYDYNHPYTVLLRADSLGQLTPLGHQLVGHLALIREEARGRDGELTLLGAQQHRAIAQRMLERFPSVFRRSAHVDARSTVVIRCILSMENALQELSRLRPDLRISHDASYHDMYYMNHADPHLDSLRQFGPAVEAYKAFAKRHDTSEQLMKRLFKDENYWRNHINAQELNDVLFRVASNVQSTELRHSISLYDLFPPEEAYENWLRINAWWYMAFGPTPLNGGVQPYSQCYLLRKMISEADSCLRLPVPGVSLRYGHDTMVMPLTCLMGVNGYDKAIADFEKLPEEGWYDYRIFPMGCNLQWVFYRPKGGKNGPVLVKILQNEDEARLPIPTQQWPYYKWDDVRAYWLGKLQRSISGLD